MSYLPQVAWSSWIRDVAIIDATSYSISLMADNQNEPGATLQECEIGFWIRDNIGNTYRVVEILSTTLLSIKVFDELSIGVGPQQDRLGYIYKSVGDGTGSFIAPIPYNRLSPTAFETARPIELDVLWKNLLHLDQTIPQTIVNGEPIHGTLIASQIVATDVLKKLQTLPIATYPSLTELSYVKGVTSNVQTQINNHTHGNITKDGKIGSTAGLPVITGTAGILTVGVTQTPQALTQSSATLTWDIANGYNARVTLTESITTFTWSTAAVAGDCGVLTVIQDGTGGRTLVLPTGHLKEGGTLTLSTAANAKDVLGWYYDGTNYFWNIGKAYA